MFCLGMKVLFWRQLYGFKHRWIMSTLSIITPILYTLTFRSLTSQLTDSGWNEQTNKVLGYLYIGSSGEDPGLFRFSHPLTVIVVPKNLGTSNLMTTARGVLQSGSSSLELRTRFLSPEDLNQSLADSVWPSVGVEFHNVTEDQLKYTLHPVIVSKAPGNISGIDDDISPYSLLLQAAIDAAYMQTHFPERSFLKLQNFDDDMTNRSIPIEGSTLLAKLAHSCVSFGMWTLIIFMASCIAQDKSNGVRELLSVNGLPRWMVNTSWLSSASLVAATIALVEMIIIQAPIYRLLGMSAHVLLVYLIITHWTATFFGYLVASIFNHQNATMSLILVYFLVSEYVGFMTHRLGRYFVAQAFISLLPNVGSIMFMVAAVESNFESNAVISFKTMFSSSEKFVSPGLVLMLMMISVPLLLGLGLYFDAVKPGPYGRARPWYLFTGKEKPTADRWFEAGTPSEAGVYEPIKDGVPIGLECVNIVKKFGTHKVLNNVNLRIVKNSITVLLGHNGAGKTTLFSILCGMFSPTSGDFFTEEYNVFEGNINEFRSVLGYCPQENILMEELTVHEHLIVFGLLKGLVMSEAVDYSDQWTQTFNMYTMRSTQAKKLSGGSKRKLCLAIAMTGNPQYLLLDEPSAGLDIESTKKFCDILLEQKGNCTVVVTTHNMDEAEMLGERIAILAHGELKCYGSPKFLKKMLDTGYRLTCYVIRDMSTRGAIEAVTTLIPGTTILFKTNHSVTFSLSIKKTDIPDLLRKLESQFGGKMTSTLSSSTLDDVFIKVQKDLGVKIAVEDLPTISEDTIIRKSCWNFTELFKKRAKWILSPRMAQMIIYIIVLPNVMMISWMVAMNSNIKSDSSSQIVLPNSFSKHGGFVALLEHISDFAQSTPIGKSIAFEEKSKTMNFTEGMAKNYFFKYRSKVLFALHAQSSTPISPDRAGHDVSEIYSALLNALIQGNSTSIVTYNAPVLKKLTFNQVSNECPMDKLYITQMLPNIIATFSLIFLIASSYFVIFPHMERTIVFKHLQLMTGLLPAAYWLANLVFDMLIYMVSCVAMLIITACMDRTAIFLQSNVMWAFALILFLYGPSSITYSYVWSFCCRSHSWAICLFSFVSALFPLAVEFIFIILWPLPWIIEYVNLLMPHLVLGISMDKLTEWAIKKRDCTNCPSSNQGKSCFYVNHNTLLEVLKSPLITLAVQPFAWFVLIMLFDHGMGRKLKGGIARVFCGCISYLGHDVDPGVALERKRVRDLVMKHNKDEQPELIVDGLGKNYCARTAVYDVTFAAERGECFGLVGVNGSGKTTTFGMLAALMSPTKGTAIVEGTWKMTRCEYNYIKRIGYCPQHSALLLDLTGRNILKLFGRLCGVPRRQINELVDKWIKALDMTEIAKRPCGHYSGGNKRKLSLAIALIGNAPVALLDEPTAGVDPVVRRRIWEILSNRLEHHRTIILTSHTMSECEAICDRLTIMVNGVMKCLGPIPILKKTFGKCSILEVKFTSNSTIQEQDVVKSKIESEFHGYITLEDRLVTRLKFNLNTENTKIYVLFETMLRIESDYKVVEDFTLVEAPLEQVFMMFAKN